MFGKAGSVEIAARILQYRKSLKYPQAKMAAILNISNSAYKNYELGKRDLPAKVISKYHEEFGVAPNWILIGEEEKTARKPDIDYYNDLFTAFNKARETYEAFEKRNVGWSDLTSDESREIRTTGAKLNKLGGTDCMSAAIKAFFPEDEGRVLNAGSNLNHLWSGIDNWVG